MGLKPPDGVIPWITIVYSLGPEVPGSGKGGGGGAAGSVSSDGGGELWVLKRST